MHGEAMPRGRASHATKRKSWTDMASAYFDIWLSDMRYHIVISTIRFIQTTYSLILHTRILLHALCVCVCVRVRFVCKDAISQNIRARGEDKLRWVRGESLSGHGVLSYGVKRALARASMHVGDVGGPVCILHEPHNQPGSITDPPTQAHHALHSTKICMALTGKWKQGKNYSHANGISPIFPFGYCRNRSNIKINLLLNRPVSW